MTNYIYNDGGRSKYFRGQAGDCAARAMAIALELDYKQVYNELAAQNKIAGRARSARNGMMKDDLSEVLKRHGWVWHKAPRFQGRKARCSDMPHGTVIARQSRHVVAVIDGVPHDTSDSSIKMVYGYWAKV